MRTFLCGGVTTSWCLSAQWRGEEGEDQDVDEGQQQQGHDEAGALPPGATAAQAERLEREIDRLNEALPSLDSFILPGGSAAAAAVHLARAIVRRAERSVVAAAEARAINPPARTYLNRLSDLLFVLARHVNASAALGGTGDIKWVPGASR